MDNTATIRLTKVYRVWDSARDLFEYANWIPEVVGTEKELCHIGSVPLCISTEERFAESDVSRYRRMLADFRQKNR